MNACAQSAEYGGYQLCEKPDRYAVDKPPIIGVELHDAKRFSLTACR